MLRPLALLAALAALGGAAVAAPAGATNPTLNVGYDAGTLTLTLGDGTSVGQGTVLAPGVYDIIFDVQSGGPTLLLTGPGVSITWNEPAEAVFTRVLAPDSAYSLSDDNPGGSAIAFRTGDPVPITTTTTAPVPGGPDQTNSSLVGSAAAAGVAPLDASVTGSGLPTLTIHGRTVSRLPRGSYRLSVVDRTRRAGLELVAAGGAVRSLTGRGFVGVRRVTVRLTPGRWTLSAGHGEQRTFLVTA